MQNPNDPAEEALTAEKFSAGNDYRRLVFQSIPPYLLILMGLYLFPEIPGEVALKHLWVLVPYAIWHLFFIFPVVVGVGLTWWGDSIRVVRRLRRGMIVLTIAAMASLPVTLIPGLFGGPVSWLFALHHLTIALFLFGVSFLIGPSGVYTRSIRPNRTWVFYGLLPGFAIWSLLVFVASFGGAIWLSDGREFCIAKPEIAHGIARDYGPIDSWAWLRGRNIATTRTENERTLVKYFHAILLVRTEHGNKAWSWSYKHMAWTEVLGYREGLSASCAPRSNFLFNL